MIHHIVFFNMLAEALGSSSHENAGELVARLKELKGKISVLKTLEAGLDFSKTANSFEVGLYTTFETAEDLETYRVHPDHQLVVEFVKQTTGDRRVVDFEA